MPNYVDNWLLALNFPIHIVKTDEDSTDLTFPNFQPLMGRIKTHLDKSCRFPFTFGKCATTTILI